MSHKKEVTLPLLLGLVGIVSPYLLPSSEIVEKFLIFYLKYKWLLWEAKASFGAIVFLLPYYFYQKVIKSVSPKKQEELLLLIRESCDSNFKLRHVDIHKKSNSILLKYSSLGYRRIPGAAFGEFADLYVKELYAYTDILLDTFSKILDSDKFKLKTEPLISLAQEMIQSKANEFNSYFHGLVDHHSQFHQGPQPDIMIGTKTSFTTQISYEAALSVSRISSQIELKNVA